VCQAIDDAPKQHRFSELQAGDEHTGERQRDRQAALLREQREAAQVQANAGSNLGRIRADGDFHRPLLARAATSGALTKAVRCSAGQGGVVFAYVAIRPLGAGRSNRHFMLTHADLVVLREMYLAFFQQMQARIARSEPSECVALYSTQLLRLDAH
jgi:hypothetical protein